MDIKKRENQEKEIKKNNSLKFEKFKLRKLICSNAEYKKKFDSVVKKLILEIYNTKNGKNKNMKENNKINLHFMKKKVKPTPFQIYEQIKSHKINNSRENHFGKLFLSPNTKKSSISTSTKNLNRNKFCKINSKYRYFSFISPLKKRINKTRNSSFGNNINLCENSNDLTDFSKLIIKNYRINKDKNSNLRNIYRRNVENNISSFKTNNDFFKKSFLSNENLSFYKIKNKKPQRNLPKISKSLSQQIHLKT